MTTANGGNATTRSTTARPVSGRAGNPAARGIGVVLLGVAAAVHLLLIGQFGLPVLDVLFVVSALGLMVGAVLLVVRARLGWVVGGGTALLTAIGYLLRSTVGLPGVLPQPFPFSTPPSGPVSFVAEVLVVVLAGWALAGGGALFASKRG